VVIRDPLKTHKTTLPKAPLASTPPSTSTSPSKAMKAALTSTTALTAPEALQAPKVDTTSQLLQLDVFSKKNRAEPPTVRPSMTGPVEGAKSNFALRLSEMARVQRPALGAKERLEALLYPHGGAQIGEVKPPPSSSVLMAQIKTTLGPVAKHLSPLEVAQALGQPGWASAVAELGISSPGARAPHFLLAAHLSRWMEGIYTGADLNDVVNSWKAAHPHLKERFDYVDARLLAGLQQAYPFVPQWQKKPETTTVASSSIADILAMPDAEGLYASKLNEVLQSFSEVPLSLPLTAGVGARLAEDQRFAGHNVVMVQHMLGQANPFLDAMCAAGLEVEKADYVGVPYQQNLPVKTTLEKAYGINVDVPPTGDIDAMYQHVGAAIDRAVERNKKNGEPILVIDDGGYASKWIHEHHKDKQHLFKVVEQTTRGLTEIKKLDNPQFPIVDVAGSYGKRFESAQVGDAVVQTIRRVLDEVQQTPTRKEVLIVGAGKVGLGVADSFKGDGARVSVFDPGLSPQRVAQLQKKGYRVITDKAEALKEKFLVVGCSGHRSIDMADFAKVSSPVFMASASSKRVEIDIQGLAELATDKDGKLRRILGAKVNEQETYHYWTEDGRIVTALADGLPVNFQDVNSIAPELIDHTMSLMLLGAGQAVRSTAKGLDALDARAQFEVQARMEGLAREPERETDIGVIAGDVVWYGSEAQWKDIASSPATPPEVIEALVRTIAVPDDALMGRMTGPRMGRYQPTLNPVLLAALEAPKQITDGTVDLVLSSGYLPHVAHLARNPELSPAQTQRVLAWVEQALQWAQAGAAEGSTPAVAPIGARLRQGLPYMVVPGPMHMNLVDSTPAIHHDPGHVVSQLASILFTHPACPRAHIDAALNDPQAFLFGQSPSVVHLLRNPTLTAAELETFAINALSLFRLIPRQTRSERELELDPFMASQMGDLKEMGDVSAINKRALYAYDVFDVLDHHPNAGSRVHNTAVSGRHTLIDSFKGSLVLRGVEAWQLDTTGIPIPDYV
jgi:S-adenosylhomocysteine hydrolase